MNDTWRWRIWGSVVCLVLIMGFVLLRSARNAPSVQLRDGSVLKLECVKYQRKAPEQPTPLARWITAGRDWFCRVTGRPTFSSRPVQSDALVYWISRRDKVTGKYLDLDCLSYATAVDSHGCEFVSLPYLMVQAPNFMSGARLVPKAPAGSKYILASGELPVFPRRQRDFKLRIYDQHFAVAGEMSVRNPLFRKYPIWTPEPMPITRSLGTSSMSLVGISDRWTTTTFDGAAVRRLSLAPQFKLRSDWELTALEIEDATGNQGTAGDLNAMHRFILQRFNRKFHPEPLSVEFRLCTNESAWKLRATFFQTSEAQFAPNEVWRIPKLKIPAAGTASVLGQSNTWQGVTVRLCAIAGAGDVVYSNGVPTSVGPWSGQQHGSGSGRTVGGVLVSDVSVGTDKPGLMLQITGLTDQSRFQAFTQTADSTSVCPEPSNANDYKLLTLPVPEGTDAVDMLLVIQKPQVLDFLIQPDSPKSD